MVDSAKALMTYLDLWHLSASTINLARNTEYQITKVKSTAAYAPHDTKLIDSHSRSPHLNPRAFVGISFEEIDGRNARVWSRGISH